MYARLASYIFSGLWLICSHIKHTVALKLWSLQSIISNSHKSLCHDITFLRPVVETLLLLKVDYLNKVNPQGCYCQDTVHKFSLFDVSSLYPSLFEFVYSCFPQGCLCHILPLYPVFPDRTHACMHTHW